MVMFEKLNGGYVWLKQELISEISEKVEGKEFVIVMSNGSEYGVKNNEENYIHQICHDKKVE